MYDIIQQSEQLKDAPDKWLLQELQKPTGQYEQFLVMAETRRRKSERDQYKLDQQAAGAADQTVKDRYINEMAGPAAAQLPNSAGISDLQKAPQMGGAQTSMRGYADGGAVVKDFGDLAAPASSPEMIGFGQPEGPPVPDHGYPILENPPGDIMMHQDPLGDMAKVNTEIKQIQEQIRTRPERERLWGVDEHGVHGKSVWQDSEDADEAYLPILLERRKQLEMYMRELGLRNGPGTPDQNLPQGYADGGSVGIPWQETAAWAHHLANTPQPEGYAQPTPPPPPPPPSAIQFDPSALDPMAREQAMGSHLRMGQGPMYPTVDEIKEYATIQEHLRIMDLQIGQAMQQGDRDMANKLARDRNILLGIVESQVQGKRIDPYGGDRTAMPVPNNPPFPNPYKDPMGGDRTRGIAPLIPHSAGPRQYANGGVVGFADGGNPWYEQDSFFTHEGQGVPWNKIFSTLSGINAEQEQQKAEGAGAIMYNNPFNPSLPRAQTASGRDAQAIGSAVVSGVETIGEAMDEKRTADALSRDRMGQVDTMRAGLPGRDDITTVEEMDQADARRAALQQINAHNVAQLTEEEFALMMQDPVANSFDNLTSRRKEANGDGYSDNSATTKLTPEQMAEALANRNAGGTGQPTAAPIPYVPQQNNQGLSLQQIEAMIAKYQPQPGASPAMKMFEEFQANRTNRVKQDRAQMLMSMGGAMAGGTSPYFADNFGAGTTAGANMAAKQAQQRRANEMGIMGAYLQDEQANNRLRGQVPMQAAQMYAATRPRADSIPGLIRETAGRTAAAQGREMTGADLTEAAKGFVGVSGMYGERARNLNTWSNMNAMDRETYVEAWKAQMRRNDPSVNEDELNANAELGGYQLYIAQSRQSSSNIFQSEGARQQVDAVRAAAKD